MTGPMSVNILCHPARSTSSDSPVKVQCASPFLVIPALFCCSPPSEGLLCLALLLRRAPAPSSGVGTQHCIVGCRSENVRCSQHAENPDMMLLIFLFFNVCLKALLRALMMNSLTYIPPSVHPCSFSFCGFDQTWIENIFKIVSVLNMCRFVLRSLFPKLCHITTIHTAL